MTCGAGGADGYYGCLWSGDVADGDTGSGATVGGCGGEVGSTELLRDQRCIGFEFTAPGHGKVVKVGWKSVAEAYGAPRQCLQHQEVRFTSLLSKLIREFMVELVALDKIAWC